MSLSAKKECCLYIAGIFLSVLLSLLTIHNHPVFNSDGSEYIQSAQAYLNHGFSAARHAYGWPFYPISFALISKHFDLSLVQSAYLFSVVFSAGVCIVFLRLLRRINKVFLLQVLGLIVFLTWHTFSKLRADFVRDQAFWFFMLLALLAFLNAEQSRKVVWCVIWALFTVLAGLYRIEALSYLVLVPFVVFVFSVPWRTKLQLYCQFNLFGLALLFLSALFIFHTALMGGFFHRVMEVAPSHSGYAATASMSFARKLFDYVVIFFGNISFVYWALIFLGIFRYSLMQDDSPPSYLSADQKKAIIFYVLLTLLTTMSFYNNLMIMSSRYLMFAYLVLMLWAPLGLIVAYKLSYAPGAGYSFRRFLFPIIVILLIAELVADLYPFGTSHRYVKQAADWVRQSVPAQIMLYTCKGRLVILANRAGEHQSVGWRFNDPTNASCGQAVEFPALSKYNPGAEQSIYAIDVNGGKLSLRRALKQRFGDPIKQFENRHHDAMLFFNVTDSHKR